LIKGLIPGEEVPEVKGKNKSMENFDGETASKAIFWEN
jgi:hypothetical protein